MAKCGGCGADIIWGETVGGKRQPFDREPNAGGNRLLVGRGPDEPPLVLIAGEVAAYLPMPEQEALVGARYMPHHATCPNAEDYRKS